MSRNAPSVMVVDDDGLTCETLFALLESRGYAVTIRSQAIGTTAAILQDAPDIVVLDVEMPGLSGDGVLRALSKNQRVRFRMPVIVLHSALPRTRLEELAKSHAVAGFIEKGDARGFLPRFEALVGPRVLAGA